MIDNDISVKKVDYHTDFQQCMAIRHQVFILGQNVPQEIEIDGQDMHCDHYLLFVKEQSAGVARVRYIKDIAKIQRVAILPEFQGRHLGQVLMEFIIADINQHHHVKKIKLSSQVHALVFYEKLGFSVCSDEYMDAGIPHKDMELVFTYPQQ